MAPSLACLRPQDITSSLSTNSIPVVSLLAPKLGNFHVVELRLLMVRNELLVDDRLLDDVRLLVHRLLVMSCRRGHAKLGAITAISSCDLHLKNVVAAATLTARATVETVASARPPERFF